MKENKKKIKIVAILVLILVLLGVAGGVSIKLLFFANRGGGAMPNTEANRLISYLGINDYKYTDKVGSSFSVGDAKKLLEAANIDQSKVSVNLEYIPGFLPLNRSEFKKIYKDMIEVLALDRLNYTSLYIFDVDSTNNIEIDDTIYEMIRTNQGDFYMEKDYGMNHDYIGQVVKVYVNNNEIILCDGESDAEVTISNAFVSKISDKEGKDNLILYVTGQKYEFPLSETSTVDKKISNCLCDVIISNGGVTSVESHMNELVETKVTSYQDGVLTAEGYENPLYIDSAFNVYNTKGELNARQSAGILLGFEKVSLYIKDNMVEAALLDDDVYAKNIRVLISTTNYESYYHNSLVITSDDPFTVSYGKKVDEYEAGTKLEFRNGSKELEKGTAKITSKRQGGKIQINTITRQCGNPAYRGTLELKKDDKGVLVVNDLPLEDYLYGVVPSEMPSSYEKEALKAQAICARAYAYRQMESEQYAAYGAHLDDSVETQVYNNVLEDEATCFAVDDTYGVVPVYNKDVIETFFFSTSCGATSNNKDVWGGKPEAYLIETMETPSDTVADLSNEKAFMAFIDGENTEDCFEKDEPFFRWNIQYSAQEISDAINSRLYQQIQTMPEYITAKTEGGSYTQKQIKTIGTLEEVQITKRGLGGVIEEMILVGSNETIKVEGQTNVRALITPENVEIVKQDGSTVKGWTSLPSAYFYVENKDGKFIIHGGGFGHGVGMSQNGANDMAKLGYTSKDIIAHYYTAVELKDVYDMMGK